MTIRLQEFQRRRRELMEQMEPNSIAILAAAPERIGELGGAVFACSHSLAERGIVPALKVREALAPQRVSQAIARGWQVISG